MVIKGLPLAYQKDLQEDKEGAIDAIGALALSLRAMTGMVRDLEPDVARMKAAAGEGYSTATDLADWLVRTLKLPFREAHHVTGRIVAKAAKPGVAARQAAARKPCRRSSPRITKAVFGVLSADKSVKSRAAYGGTAPNNVRRAGQTLAQAADKKGISVWQRLWAMLADTMSPPRCGLLKWLPEAVWGTCFEPCSFANPACA